MTVSNNNRAPTNDPGPIGVPASNGSTPARPPGKPAPSAPVIADNRRNEGPGRPHPTVPRTSAAATYRLGPLLRPNPVYRRVAAWLERSPRARRVFTAVEKRGKEELFGCRMCGQCALPSTGYACPMTCPKQLRNGPCGGVSPNGDCEVYPGERCVWVIAHERAEGSGHVADLARLQRPVDHRMAGSSSWVNYWLGRDDDLWTEDPGLTEPPSIRRVPVDLGLPAMPIRTRK